MIQQQETGAAPTMIQYTEFNKAFDFLNGALFGGELPKVLVTFSRKPRMLGYYSPDRWERTKIAFHEALYDVRVYTIMVLTHLVHPC